MAATTGSRSPPALGEGVHGRTPRTAAPGRFDVAHPPHPHRGPAVALLGPALVVAVVAAVVVVLLGRLLVRAADGAAPSAPGRPGRGHVPQPVPGPVVRA